MFLASVDESEVINVVRNCKKKKICRIDVTSMKEVIYHIIKPLTCNNSFENGVSPRKKLSQYLRLEMRVALTTTDNWSAVAQR